MKVIIRDTKKEGSVWAARHIVEAIKWKASQTDRPFVLGLPTGSTPLDVYAELIKMYKAGEVSFKNVITFNMDEYVGLQYELAILDAGGIDLFLGGVGEDGHLAFNEPFSSLNSRTRVMTLTQDTLEVNARFFDNDPDKVPKQAMSVGISTVCSADEVLILAFGSKKARAVKAAIEGPVSHYVTLSALQLHENGIVVLDEPAAGELKVNSYRYFKAVEAAESGK